MSERKAAAEAVHGATGIWSASSRSLWAVLVALVALLACDSVPASAMPDGRVYEVVSHPASGQDANVYVPNDGLAGFTERGIYTTLPFQVAASGEAVVYPGDPPPTGGNGSAGAGSGNEYMARRATGGGWTQTDLQPPARAETEGRFLGEYQAFSSDLSLGILSSREPLAAGVPLEAGRRPEGFQDLYLHSTSAGTDEAYAPLSTITPPHRTAAYTEQGQFAMQYDGANAGSSAAPAYSHLLFSANDALTSGIAVGDGEKEAALYDWVNGALHLINVLPDGRTDADASFGDAGGLSHVISADGSRIFWTDLDTEVSPEDPAGVTRLFARENDASADASTVQVDAAVGGGGRFWTASADGSKVFFTKGGLYEYDVESQATTDLTPGIAVLGVLAADEDGDYIYYVNSSRELELWHSGSSTFIATLAAEDGSDVSPYYSGTVGDWNPNIGERSAEATPDGHSLVFTSNQSLTGYDNEGVEELFIYDSETGDLTCMSCGRDGEPPAPSEIFDFEQNEFEILGSLFPVGENPVYQPQFVTGDGSRVFFDSVQSLVSQDVNGYADVYEWERVGAGSCREARGCVYLLSGGTGPENSYLLGASADGDDVFMITRSQLVAQDRNDDDDVYDARVGGVQPSAEIVCAGTGCQGLPPTPPIFATPSSVTFSGVGNFVTQVKQPAKTKKKSKKEPEKPKHRQRKRPERCKGSGSHQATKGGNCAAKRINKPVKGRKHV